MVHNTRPEVKPPEYSMDIDEITRELMRTHGNVRMSTADLTSLAKQASQEYLAGGTSLNDAIIKIARQHPGITADQLQRVVEYANNETFQAMFEKQAGDKNVKFPLADTREILRSLDIQARPSGYDMSDDYSSEPEKLASKNPLEADLLLMEMFGVPASSEAMDKAAGLPRALRVKPGELPLPPAARKGPAKHKDYATARLLANRAGHKDPASWGMSREDIKTEGKWLREEARDRLPKPKKKEGSAIPGGKAEEAGKTISDFDPKEVAVGMGVEREHSSDPGIRADVAADHLTEDPSYYTNPKPENWGLKEVQKEAMALVKIGGADGDLAAADLLSATSLSTIKTKCAEIGQYEEANPYGDLVRARQVVTKLANDAKAADSRNRVMLKEAMDLLTHEVKQFLLQGGNLGEVVDAMGSIHTGDRVKEAMEYMVPILEKHGFDRIRARADMIRYEMVKKAHRAVNPDNPIVTAFGAMLKLANGQEKLAGAVEDLEEQLKQINQRIKRAHHVA